MAERSPRTVVIIPTFNEVGNIRQIVGRVRAAQPQLDVLIVDDASPDGTGDAADELAAGDEQIYVLHGDAKCGLGDAYLAGFRWALDRDYEILVEMDADGSHQPEQLGRLLGAIESADLVIGSRWVPGGSVENWPRHRELLSRTGNAYIRLMLGLGVRDATAGFRAYRAEALHKIGLDEVASEGYCFQTDLSRRAVRAGLRVIEVPIDFIEREVGESKMNAKIMRESLARVTGWGISDRARQLRQRAAELRRTADRLRSGSDKNAS